MKTIHTCVASFIFAFLSGCASTTYIPPEKGDVVQIEFNAEFIQTQRADSAQVLAFKDSNSCDKHPRGIFVGLLCPNVGPGFACKGMTLSEQFQAEIPLTLKFEYKFGDITSEHGGCNNQFTFTPRSGNKYRASLKVNREKCGVIVQTSKDGKNWNNDDTVTYDKKHCIWW